MRKPNSKAVRVTALATAAAFALLPMAGASAANPANASAYGGEVNLLGIDTGKLAPSTYPPGGPSAIVPLHLPGVADIVGIFSTTSGDDATVTSSATAGTATLGILGTALTSYAISADAVSSTCTATGSYADPTQIPHSTTIANLKLTNQNVINLTVTSPQGLLTIPGVATVLIGEEISNPDGSLTVNALHIHLLGAANVADIVLGSVTCGPNAAKADVAAFSFQDLPLVLGGIALIVLIGFGIRTGIRRLGSAA